MGNSWLEMNGEQMTPEAVLASKSLLRDRLRKQTTTGHDINGHYYASQQRTREGMTGWHSEQELFWYSLVLPIFSCLLILVFLSSIILLSGGRGTSQSGRRKETENTDQKL